jgi:hypothetical protein
MSREDNLKLEEVPLTLDKPLAVKLLSLPKPVYYIGNIVVFLVFFVVIDELYKKYAGPFDYLEPEKKKRKLTSGLLYGTLENGEVVELYDSKTKKKATSYDGYYLEDLYYVVDGKQIMYYSVVQDIDGVEAIKYERKIYVTQYNTYFAFALAALIVIGIRWKIGLGVF